MRGLPFAAINNEYGSKQMLAAMKADMPAEDLEELREARMVSVLADLMEHKPAAVCVQADPMAYIHSVRKFRQDHLPLFRALEEAGKQQKGVFSTVDENASKNEFAEKLDSIKDQIGHEPAETEQRYMNQALTKMYPHTWQEACVTTGQHY